MVVDGSTGTSLNARISKVMVSVIELSLSVMSLSVPSSNPPSETTYFTNGTLSEAGTVTGASTTPTASDGYATTTAPLTTFYGDSGEEICSATATESVTGGTIRAYLLDSSDTLIADDSSVTECSGVTKLLGIMQLDDTVEITPSTTSVKTTFKVENNGTTVVYDDVADGIRFDSGPFSVSFETSE